MGLEKDWYEFTTADFIDDGEDALFIKFADTGKTVKYVPERTCKVVRRDRDEYGEFAEYSCGHVNVWQSWNEPTHCCWCGARIEEG